MKVKDAVAKLTEQGNKLAADLLLDKAMIGDRERPYIFISDIDDLAWESGLASFLTDNCDYVNAVKGAMIYFK